MNYKKIHELCLKRGITLASLAEKVGLSRAGLFKATKNESLKVSDLERIAKELNTPLYEFFDDEASYIIVKEAQKSMKASYTKLEEILEKYETLQGKFLDLILVLPENQVQALFKEKAFVEFRDLLANFINKEEIKKLPE